MEQISGEFVRVSEGQRPPLDPSSLPTPRRTPKERLQPPVRLVWSGQRIKRVIFPSGRTVEFLS